MYCIIWEKHFLHQRNVNLKKMKIMVFKKDSNLEVWGALRGPSFSWRHVGPAWLCPLYLLHSEVAIASFPFPCVLLLKKNIDKSKKKYWQIQIKSLTNKKNCQLIQKKFANKSKQNCGQILKSFVDKSKQNRWQIKKKLPTNPNKIVDKSLNPS